jgi:hypothetical protein
MNEVLTMIVALLGGGIIGAWIHYASTVRSDREKRQSTYVQQQLEKLYGPLYFLSGQNENLFDLSRSILSAHSEYFDGGNWSQNPHTQETLNRESAQTIELSNVYANQVVENNDAIVALLRNAYAFVDVEDVDVFTTFSIDALRMKEEVQAQRLKDIPMNIYKAVGEISYSRPEFLSRVRQQFADKQRLLKKYH